MLYFIPAWYKENNWCEHEQYWYIRRAHTEFDDTVKHIQLFHRKKVYPFQIMLLSYAPNFRHFLHRQGIFLAPYWSCFDAIQEVCQRRMKLFSIHDLDWPEHIQFVYSPFAMVALLHGEKYAQAEFSEDGNLIQIDIYQNGKLSRKNFYDDRGFVSSTIVYEENRPLYQDYLTEKGIWKIRTFFEDGHIEVNPRSKTFLIQYEGNEHRRTFQKQCYENIEQVIEEVLLAYLEQLKEEDMFCVAMHELHTKLLEEVLKGRKKILSFFDTRYLVAEHKEDFSFIQQADHLIAESRETLLGIRAVLGDSVGYITKISPFDSRVEFGISQQLDVEKILVLVDGMEEKRLEELIVVLGQYLLTNDNARVHLFTRLSDYNRKAVLLSNVRTYLEKAGLEEGWAREERVQKGINENLLDEEEEIPCKFFVEQCVDELSVSKCIREQRIMVDMREKTELYLHICCLSVGIPQIVYRPTEYVEDGKNGLVLDKMEQLSEAIAYYLDSVTNWNEAMVAAYEQGKKYTSSILVKKWKGVIDFVGSDSYSADRTE